MPGATFSNLRIAFIFESRAEYLKLGYSEEECGDFSYAEEIQAIIDALEKLGHQVTQVPGIHSLVEHLAAHRGKDWDLAFNVSEGFFGSARESQVPCLLEAYQIPFTFADAATLALCLNKAQTKIILAHHNIRTAPFCVIPGSEDSLDWGEIAKALPAYPVFVKPSCEGSGKGIDSLSKAKDEASLKKAVNNLRARYPHGDILVESFLPGPEYSVSILGTGAESRVVGSTQFIQSQPQDLWTQSPKLDLKEMDEQSKPFHKIASNNDETKQDIVYTICKDMAHPQVVAACKLALDTWKVLNCRDAGRIDIRFDSNDENGVPNVLEVNPIAGLSPQGSYFPQTAKYNGIAYPEMITQILESAMRRRSRQV